LRPASTAREAGGSTLSRNNTKGTPLIDPKHVHPTGQWYWAAVRFDGKHMTHYINGVKELEADATFAR